MITSLFQPRFLFSLMVSCTLFAFAANGQQAPAKPKDKDLCHVTIEQIAWGDGGSLVMLLHIHAPASKGVNLYHGSINVSDPDAAYSPFTLADSYLLDGYTGAKIGALPNLPESPHFGTMTIAVPIPAGGWREMSVAFPAPPPPPAKDGSPQPYKLMLYIPLEGSVPVAVIPPPTK